MDPLYRVGDKVVYEENLYIVDSVHFSKFSKKYYYILVNYSIAYDEEIKLYDDVNKSCEEV